MGLLTPMIRPVPSLFIPVPTAASTAGASARIAAVATVAAAYPGTLTGASIQAATGWGSEPTLKPGNRLRARSWFRTRSWWPKKIHKDESETDVLSLLLAEDLVIDGVHSAVG